MTAATSSVPPRLAWLPPSAYAFALRNWLAMMLALYVAFWLQLDGASSAATCVGILSLQTRGQALQKAVYRMGGTIVGVAASIVIASAFDQTRYLFFLACCVWLGGCAALASMLDGNRAYGAVLSGYTVSIVALPNVDTPLATFASGIDRGAAITIGILAVGVVSDLLWAPSLFPAALAKLEAAHDAVRSFAVDALRNGGASPSSTATLLKALTTLHPDVTALSVESVSGQKRYDAARSTIVSLLRMVSAARVVSSTLSTQGEDGRKAGDDLARALEGEGHHAVGERAREILTTDRESHQRLVTASAWMVLFEQHRLATESLDAMRNGRPSQRLTALRPFRSRRIALRNGLRTGSLLVVAAVALSLLSWPAVTTTLVQVGSLAGLGAINANPRRFALGALIAMPVVAVAAGITEFLILDGVDDFPLLALGMAPTIIVASLLLTVGKPLLNGVAFLSIVYFPVILSPANPQAYDPQSYLYSSFLIILTVILIFVLSPAILPTSDALRRRWMLRSARDDLRHALAKPRHRGRAPACAFRDADRIGQFSDLEPMVGDGEGELRDLIRLSDLASCVRGIRSSLGADQTLRPADRMAHAVLTRLDPGRLRELGREILATSAEGSDRRRSLQRRAAIDLLFASILVERSPGIAVELRAQS